MSLQICAPVSVIRNEKPNNSNNTCPYKTAKVRHLPQQIQLLSAQPPLPNVKHALGVHPKVASERLGHSRVAVTLDLYSHVLPGMQEDAATRVDDALQAAIRQRQK